MTRSRSEHYISESDASMLTAFREVDEGRDGVAVIQAMNANRLATLALAAATLEAARLMGPTPADQARLDALMLSVEDQYAPYYCAQEWVDEEAAIPSQVDGTDLRAHDGKPHRCVYTAGHKKADPHYCHCGSFCHCGSEL